MCTHCGCSTDKASFTEPGKVNNLAQHHWHLPHGDSKTLTLQTSLLAGNQALADANRQWLATRGITCINLMGTPGAGKTRLLEQTFSLASAPLGAVAVLEGDQQTLNDARRIQATGARAIQINTGTGCHLDAAMIRSGLDKLNPAESTTVFIENVGNLVCPALFDLGERHRIAMMAVTDGDDKPEKYPYLFAGCELIIINKMDLLPYLDFDLEMVRHHLSQLNPRAQLLLMSAQTGEGITDWFEWLRAANG